MTRKDYTNICIRKELYERFQALARTHNKTNPDFIEYLLMLVSKGANNKPHPERKPTNNTTSSTSPKDSSLESWMKQYKKDVGAESEKEPP
jgi:hypothetical protein